MKHVTLAALALAGCYTGSTPAGSTGVLVNQSTSPGALAISSRGLGPITATTKATQPALQALLPNLAVKTTDLGGGSGLVFEVFQGNEQLFYVVPDDAEGADETVDYSHEAIEHKAAGAMDSSDEGTSVYGTTIFAVFAISPRIAVDGRDWKIGQPLTSAKGASQCECWGDGEVTACFDPGSRLRLIFDDRCDDAKSDGGRAMIGKKIARVMWKVETDDDQPPLDEDRD